MGASGGTSANQNQSANNGANQANNALNGYASAGSNAGVQGVLGQYGSGGLTLQQAIAQLGNTAQSGASGPAGSSSQTNGSGQYIDPKTGQVVQDTSAGTNQGAIDQLFTSPQTAGLAAQSQVQGNSLYSGMFGPGGQLQQAGTNLTQDRQALSGNDPSYGLQASDLAAYGQASNTIGRQAAQQNQGIAQSLASRGLGSSNNGAAIGSYAGAYGNQNEALAGLQQQISQQRIQTAQGLAQARTNTDLQQQGQLGNLANSAYNSQLSSNMAGAENNYNMNAGNAAAQQQYQTNQQNLNDSQFSQAQQTKATVGGPILGILAGAANAAAGAATGGVSSAVGKGLSSAFSSTPAAK